MRFSLLFFLTILAFSCTTENLDFEAEREIKEMVHVLKLVQTKEDLQEAVPLLKRSYTKIAQILVRVKHSHSIEKEALPISEELFIELARLYEIPGFRKLIESAQEEGLRILEKEF